MCLITISYRQNPHYPFILIANRDEFYHRASSAMQYWQDYPQILGGRDLEKMGSWLGLSDSGRLCALTNYRCGKNTSQKFQTSRGDLVKNALLSTEPYPEFMSRLAGSQAYAGDYLIGADSNGLYYTDNHSPGKTYQTLDGGIYGLCNASLNTSWPKLSCAKAQLAELSQSSDIEIDQLKDLMSDRTLAKDIDLPETGISIQWERALSAQFIQMDQYGTRAKTIILQDRSGKTQICEIRYDHQGYTGESNYELQLPVFGSN